MEKMPKFRALLGGTKGKSQRKVGQSGPSPFGYSARQNDLLATARLEGVLSSVKPRQIDLEVAVGMEVGLYQVNPQERFVLLPSQCVDHCPSHP